MGNIHTVGPNEALIVSGKVLSTGNQYSSDDVMTEFDTCNKKIMGEAYELE